jgi:post-segregation antitoxin (ccd killing protein)
MVVTVNVPDELAAAAKARGLSLEAYVQEILAQQLARAVEPRQPRTQEEIRSWLDSLAQFSDKIPPCPTRFRASGSTRTTTRCRSRRVSLIRTSSCA